MSKPQFRPIPPLDVPDSALEAVNDRLNVPVMVRNPKDAKESTVTASRQQPRVEPAKVEPEDIEVRMAVNVPQSLMDQLRETAARKRVSVRHLVLVALKAQGYRIDASEMVGDGRRGR